LLSRENFTLEHIMRIKGNVRVDHTILERCIYAFGLLEALAVAGLPFIFKGGTCLMLLLKTPRRLSTDIDIIVKPGTNVQPYLERAAQIFPFISLEQQNRLGKNNIVKQHYKYTYDSPISKRPFYILLDIVYEDHHYSKLIQKRITHDFLITHDPYSNVYMPSTNCILGDKLTAFAPYTTGIQFGVGKEVEILKQMYDIATLIDVCDDFNDVYSSYISTVKTEMAYRSLSTTEEAVLEDTIEAAACVAGRGNYRKDQYTLFLKGIQGITFHIYSERFNRETAAKMACKVMYMAACILTKTEFERIEDFLPYAQENISNSKYAVLSSLRRLDPEAFAYVVKTIHLLQT